MEGYFWCRHKLLRATWFYDFHIVKSPPFFRSSFILEIKNIAGKGRENIVMAALVEFLVWLRNVAEAEKRAPLGCRRGFVNPLTTRETPQNLHTVILICSLIYSTVFIEENCEQHFCFASNLSSLLPNRWLGLCFGIVATVNISYKACI